MGYELLETDFHQAYETVMTRTHSWYNPKANFSWLETVTGTKLDMQIFEKKNNRENPACTIFMELFTISRRYLACSYT